MVNQLLAAEAARSGDRGLAPTALKMPPLPGLEPMSQR